MEIINKINTIINIINTKIKYRFNRLYNKQLYQYLLNNNITQSKAIYIIEVINYILTKRSL